MGMALVIAIALSLDGFGVGMAYGLKRIRLTPGSLCIIGFCTALAMSLSMLFGHLIAPMLTVISPRTFGAVILILIGCYQLYQAMKNRVVLQEAIPVMATVAQDINTYKPLFSINLSMFGLVIQVLHTPDVADRDGSGIISANESILLGMALSMDAFAAGMSVTMTGISSYVIAMVALLQVMMIWAGQGLTGKMPMELLAKVKFLPGIVLMIIGILKII